MSEGTDNVFCPQCGGTIYVPQKSWAGGDRPQAYRLCSCEPLPISEDLNESQQVQMLTKSVVELTKWVNILLRQVPRSSGPVYPGSVYISEDLHNQNLALPEHVANGILKDNEKSLREYNGKAEIYVNICLYCGKVQASHTGDKVGEIRLLGYKLCDDCDKFKRENPMPFQWMSKAMRFGYVRAPEQPMPVMPPVPPPEPPEAIKAITMEGASGD